jgi:hypothetical protein
VLFSFDVVDSRNAVGLFRKRLEFDRVREGEGEREGSREGKRRRKRKKDWEERVKG